MAVIKESGLKYEIGPMSTAVEADDLETIFELVKKVHAAHVAQGAQRVAIDLKIDDRRDKKASMAQKKIRPERTGEVANGYYFVIRPHGAAGQPAGRLGRDRGPQAGHAGSGRPGPGRSKRP